MATVVGEEKRIEGEVGNLINEDRVLNFSDAVFAFAATLLILKIDLPDMIRAHIATNFSQAFLTLGPQYLANIISFAVIGYYWLNHHAIFGMIKRYNMRLVWVNLVFLLFLSFLPFPVDLYGDFLTTPIVVAFYSASLAVVGYLLFLVWLSAAKNHALISHDISKRRVNYYSTRLLLAPIVFTIAIPLVYIDPIIAQLSWVFILVGIVVINKVFHMKGISKIEQASL